MGETITVMTWNVHGEIGASTEKIRRQTKFFDKHHSDTDLFLLQAVNYDKEEGGWTGQLGKFLQYFGGKRGYYCTHTGDWVYELYNTDIQPYHNISAPFNRCNLTVSRWPIDRQPLDLRNRGNGKPVGLNYFYSNFLTGLLVSDIHHPSKKVTDSEALEVWNASIIHGAGWKEEKINTLETVYARIYLQNKKTNKKIILGGDFNAPKKELSKQDSDEKEIEITPHNGNGYQATNRPFYGNPYRYRDTEGGSEEFTFSQRWKDAEGYIFDSEKGDWDMSDAYWDAEKSLKRSSFEDHSFDFNSDDVDSKRLDHILVDDHFDVKYCEIQNGEDTDANGFDASDHAPVVAKLEIS